MTRTRLKPLRQGGLDSLCGVYSIINAAQLVLEPSARLAREDQLALFTALIEELARKGELHDAIINGLAARQVWRLAKQAARHLREEHHVELVLDRPFRKEKPADFGAVAAEIERGTRDGVAYIVEIREWKYHLTVVRDLTAKSLLLQDSAGVKFVRRASCQLGYREEEGKHTIAAPSIIRLSRADSG